MRRVQLTGLWHHPDRLKLWVGQTIALFGSQDTYLALPLTAANGKPPWETTAAASSCRAGVLARW